MIYVVHVVLCRSSVIMSVCSHFFRPYLGPIHSGWPIATSSGSVQVLYAPAGQLLSC